jgi:hypothetical protein
LMKQMSGMRRVVLSNDRRLRRVSAALGGLCNYRDFAGMSLKVQKTPSNEIFSGGC